MKRDELPTSYRIVATDIGSLSMKKFVNRLKKQRNITPVTVHLPTLLNGNNCQICQPIYPQPTKRIKANIIIIVTFILLPLYFNLTIIYILT